MGTITVRLSDEVERLLRRRAAQLYGATRGALSMAQEEAERTWLSSPNPRRGEGVLYRALREGVPVAEAGSLEELAERLRERGEHVRGLRIVRIPAPPAERRLGLRERRVST